MFKKINQMQIINILLDCIPLNYVLIALLYDPMPPNINQSFIFSSGVFKLLAIMSYLLLKLIYF